MTATGEEKPRPESLIGGVELDPDRLEDLVDARALTDFIASYERIFGIPVRLESSSGRVLHGLAHAAASDGERSVVVPIECQGRRVGTARLGPFAPPSPVGANGSTEETDAAPRFAPERAAELGEHLATSLEVVLFSGHRAKLFSQMHLASVAESYRELSANNAALEHAYEQLKEVDRLKSNFLATISHELRTPLTSIMGYGEMLADGLAGPLTSEQLEFVATIRRKSEQLLALILSLLDLVKLESGTLSVRRTATSVGRALEEVRSTLAPIAAKRDVSLLVDVEKGLPAVLGDLERLRQVFLNLAENAIKFSEAGGIVRLEASKITEEPDEESPFVLLAPVVERVRVRVIDTGIGIPGSKRGRIFDAFYQVDQAPTRERGGAGLGLAIVKRILDAHDARITVEANEPRGTVFVLDLPLARPDAVTEPPSSP